MWSRLLLQIPFPGHFYLNLLGTTFNSRCLSRRAIAHTGGRSAEGNINSVLTIKSVTLRSRPRLGGRKVENRIFWGEDRIEKSLFWEKQNRHGVMTLNLQLKTKTQSFSKSPLPKWEWFSVASHKWLGDNESIITCCTKVEQVSNVEKWNQSNQFKLWKEIVAWSSFYPLILELSIFMETRESWNPQKDKRNSGWASHNLERRIRTVGSDDTPIGGYFLLSFHAILSVLLVIKLKRLSRNLWH